MATINYYEIYDIKAKKWIDGQYIAKEVQKITGCKGKPNQYVNNNAVINGRYILRVAEEPKEGRTREWQWAHEWDKIRKKLLRSAKREQQS